VVPIDVSVHGLHYGTGFRWLSCLSASRAEASGLLFMKQGQGRISHTASSMMHIMIRHICAKRMKTCYALAFMHGGIAQVMAENETNVVLSHTSTFSTLTKLLAGIRRTFGDPDRRGWHVPNCIPEDDYGHDSRQIHGKFEMLAGRTGFNEAALRAHCHVPSQTSPTHPPDGPRPHTTRIED